MAQVKIYAADDAVELYAGDKVKYFFRAKVTNSYLLGLAIDRVDAKLAEDGRITWTAYSYQPDYVDEITGEAYPAVIYEGTVNEYPRIDQAEATAHPQEAGFAPVVIGSVIAGLIVAAAMYLLDAKRLEVLEKIATDPNQPIEVRKEAVKALAGETSVGTGLQTLGGGLIALAVVAGIIWFASQGKQRSRAEGTTL